MKKLRLQSTATQYTTTRNRYGDLVLSVLQTIPCLYRDVSRLNQLPNREEVNIQGIFWFDPDTTVGIGDVFGYAGRLYRIEQVTVARQLVTSNQVHFVKCLVSLYRAIS